MKITEAGKKLRVGRKLLYKICRSRQMRATKEKSGWDIKIPIDRTLMPIDVARNMQITVRQVQHWCANGNLRAIKIGNRWRIDYKDAARMMLNRQ